MRLAIAALMVGLALPGLAAAEEIGAVDTVFKWLGPNHKIVVEAFDDPMVDGVTCYLSRAKTGGIKGGLGLAEDRAEASIACRQVGPIRIKGKLKALKYGGNGWGSHFRNPGAPRRPVTEGWNPWTTSLRRRSISRFISSSAPAFARFARR